MFRWTLALMANKISPQDLVKMSKLGPVEDISSLRKVSALFIDQESKWIVQKTQYNTDAQCQMLVY